MGLGESVDCCSTSLLRLSHSDRSVYPHSFSYLLALLLSCWPDWKQQLLTVIWTLGKVFTYSSPTVSVSPPQFVSFGCLRARIKGSSWCLITGEAVKIHKFKCGSVQTLLVLSCLQLSDDVLLKNNCGKTHVAKSQVAVTRRLFWSSVFFKCLPLPRSSVK